MRISEIFLNKKIYLYALYHKKYFDFDSGLIG